MTMPCISTANVASDMGPDRISLQRADPRRVKPGPGKELLPALARQIYWVSFGSSAVIPSAHQYMQYWHSRPAAPGGNWSMSACTNFSPAGTMTLPCCPLSPGKTSKRLNCRRASVQRILHQLQIRGWQFGRSRLWRLAFHEAEQPRLPVSASNNPTLACRCRP